MISTNIVKIIFLRDRKIRLFKEHHFLRSITINKLDTTNSEAKIRLTETVHGAG